MNFQPVVQREVRVASRRKETWRLRLAFAGGALGAFALGMIWPDTSPANRGQVALICLCVCGFALSLLAGPYLTADAISEERREGTLGLLFLTPLSGWQIITGKMSTHALQAGYGWMAVFPVYFLPVLMGGVGAAEVARLLLVLLVALLMSIACGLFWSTICTEARTSVMATLLSLLLLVFLPWVGPFLVDLTHSAGARPGPFQLSPMTALVFSFHASYARNPQLAGSWQYNGALTFWFSIAIQVILTMGLLTAASCLLPRVWRRAEEGSSKATARGSGWSSVKQGTAPPAWLPAIKDSPLVWFFGRGLRRSGWLRLLTGLNWLLFLVMVLLSAGKAAEVAFITAFCLAFAQHLIMRVEYAFDATRRLQEDRRSGALELLLTTPVNDPPLAAAYREAMRRAGRWTLTGTLAMNLMLELCIIVLFRHLDMNHGAWFIFSVWFVGGAVLLWADWRTMPWLAIRQAGRNRSQLKAAGVLLATLQLPAWITFALTFLLAGQSGDEGLIGLMFCGWLLACLIYNFWLVRRCQTWLRRGLRWQVAEGK